MRCLIIDDDESPRLLMERLVTRAGHRAVACSSADDGIATAAATSFDVAIVDMEMPGKNGPATITELRRIDPRLRILVVSGHDDRKHVLAALHAGADGYLLKDELSESLPSSLQDVRAGNTPLSPRVAAIMIKALRQLARGTGSPLLVDATIGRIKTREG
jgi:DNA-binding NarL/FixJ family response regulator